MIARNIAFGAALCLVSSAGWADEPVSPEEYAVPPPVVVEEQEVEVVEAAPPPWVELETRSVAAGIGVSWGEGILTFEGRKYGFSVKGLSLGDLGASKLSAIGDVQNLEDPADFAGRYVAVEAGIAAGVGSSVVTMRNEHGVVITLQSDLKGAQLTLGAEGFSIAMN